MKRDDFDTTNELQRLYRATARERTSASTDAVIMQAARSAARRKRRRGHFIGVAMAAAAMLVVFVGRVWQRQRESGEAIRAHYAAITLPYLLHPQVGEDAFERATRYLLDRREFEQPSSQSLDNIRVDPQPQGT